MWGTGILLALHHISLAIYTPIKLSSFPLILEVPRAFGARDDWFGPGHSSFLRTEYVDLTDSFFLLNVWDIVSCWKPLLHFQYRYAHPYMQNAQTPRLYGLL